MSKVKQIKNMKLKYYFITFLSLIFDHDIKGQYPATFISSEYTNILAFSIQISYSSNNTLYTPYYPDISYVDAMAIMQARYDRNFAMISTEYTKLMNLELINIHNK
jgi:hypothetical protein